MEQLALTGPTLAVREGYAALAREYRRLAQAAEQHERRFGTRNDR